MWLMEFPRKERLTKNHFNPNKIRDLFKVKLYTIRSETKKKRERERERKKREREKRERERENMI